MITQVDTYVELELRKRIAAKDPRYVDVFGLAGVPLSPLTHTAMLPCIHTGEPCGPKGWHLCEHADEPLGSVVCACKGCGPRCPGYVPKLPGNTNISTGISKP